MAAAAGTALCNYLHLADHLFRLFLYAGLFEPDRDSKADKRKRWFDSRNQNREDGRVPYEDSEQNSTAWGVVSGVHCSHSNHNSEFVRFPDLSCNVDGRYFTVDHGWCRLGYDVPD